VRGHLLDPLPDSLVGLVDVVAGNVPYVAPVAAIWQEWAPRRTIEGIGVDGLGLVRELASSAKRFLRPGGVLAVQVTDWQWNLLSESLTNLGYEALAPFAPPIDHVIIGVARKGRQAESRD
jgi:release factor glutamine methyltransferase